MILQLFPQKVLLLTLFLGPMINETLAQTAEDSIKNTIEHLFTGMRQADSAQVKKTLDPVARMLTVDSTTHVRETPVEQFLKAVGTPHDAVWDERVLSYQINVDGNLATAWTPYHFYRGSNFSHCGVNAFQLYRSKSGWKIIQITDTRRLENCTN